MTIRIKPIDAISTSSFNPVIVTFIIKTLVMGVLMAFCGYRLHPKELQEIFPWLPLGNLYIPLGALFLSFAVIGAHGIITNCRFAKNLFVLAGIIFSSGMATTVLFADFLSVNGVSYGIDALVLVWIFVHAQLKRSIS